MMPMYMNSSQHPQGHSYCQGFVNHPHASSSQISCEHWPTPSPCYGSCFHGNFPAYAPPYWPPCYQQQVPYPSCCGNHSVFPPHAPPYYAHQQFPVGYQHQHGNESEKDVHRCTKCSPHVCYPKKNDSSVVIEEHEPEIEKGKQGEVSQPVRSKNSSYPVIWIPHENARSQISGQPPADVKAPEDMTIQKSDPKSWSGILPFDESTIRSLLQNQDRRQIQNGKPVGFPFDIDKLKSLLQGRDTKHPQIQRNKEEQGQLPYPIYWIPSQEKREDSSENRERSYVGDNMKSLLSNLHANEDQNKGGEAKLEPKKLSDAEEKNSMRSVPVENRPKEPRNIPVNLPEKHVPKPTEQPKTIAKKEPVGNSKKEQSPSPPKASRLPPVCLRVDPLPRKRNGGSKSPSPPRRKTSEETNAASPPSSNKDTRIAPEAGSNVKSEEVNKEKTMSKERVNADSVENSPNMLGRADCGTVKPSEAKENKEMPLVNVLTEEEAARIIQSMYRGYDVRRWEPIKKLKEIATVREQMGDVKRRMEALKVSTNAHGEEKEIVILGEMVMSLLLKLDSVQGLHPSVREYRKSLARELDGIQEVLDSMKNSSLEEKAVQEQVEITSQTGQGPVNLELDQLAEETIMVSESNAEEVGSPSSGEHNKSLMNNTDVQQVGDGEEQSGLSEALVAEPVSATETGISEAVSKPGENETVSKSNAEKVLSPPSEDHTSVMNTTDGQQVAEGEGEKGLSEIETLVRDTVSATERGISEADPTLIPENIVAVESVIPISPSSADGYGTTETNNEDENVMAVKLEESPYELVEETRGPGFEAPESTTEVYVTETNTPDNEDGKGDDGTGLPLEKDVELAELLPVGVIDDEMQLFSQDSLSCARELETPAMNAERESKEETSEQQEKTEQPAVTEVDIEEKSEETRKLMEENQRYKEIVETLVKAGREQLEAISNLTGRVKSLEKKLSHKKKKKTHIGRRNLNRGKESKLVSDVVNVM